jgi:hypothetical protein
MDIMYICYGHLVYRTSILYILLPLMYFMAIWCILWPFGIFYRNLVTFFGYFVYFIVIW